MKIRNIPYGYQYKNGSIAIQEKETETVKRIFTEYLNGLSLLKIAENLNNEQIEYMPGVCGWNKSRIKRIIEDERYLGTNGYPPIIDEDTHKTLIRIKSEKNTQKAQTEKQIYSISVCRYYVQNAVVRCTDGMTAAENVRIGGCVKIITAKYYQHIRQ